MRQVSEVARLVESEGVIVRKHHPELAGGISWLVAQGVLVAVLPGVYSVAGCGTNDYLRMRATMLRHPDAVLVGAAAARLSFWPNVPVRTVSAATRTNVAPQPGFDLRRRRIPPELIVESGGFRFTAPALTAIEMATFADANPIDRVLRLRMATLDGMYEALRLTADRPGNRERYSLLRDSRDQPWSEAERFSHRLLRKAAIHGWEANLPVVLDTKTFYLDVGFEAVKLAVEIDGRIHEEDADLFESDRWRQNALVADDWTVLRFTWDMLTNHPDAFITAVQHELAKKKRAQ